MCNIKRIPPKRTEGYCHSGSAISRGYRRTSETNFSGAHKEAVQPAVKVLGPRRAPRTKLKKCRAAQDLSRANSRVSHAKQKRLLSKLKKIVHRFIRVLLLLYKWLAIARRACRVYGLISVKMANGLRVLG